MPLEVQPDQLRWDSANIVLQEFEKVPIQKGTCCKDISQLHSILNY